MPEITAPNWYLELPNDIQQKAITNFKNAGLLAYQEYKYSSLKDALKCGFVWEKTPEGFQFWQDVFNQL